MFNIVRKLAIAIAINFCFVAPVLAVTQQLQLDSTTGYTVKTTFSYDNTQTPPVIHEQGKGKTQAIDSMRVSFYNPSGELIASYDNIIDGKAQGEYFEFAFDPATRKLMGNVDFGGESAGEIYLKGTANKELSLIEIAPSGEEKAIDRITMEVR